jgi:hypothetical protein
LRFSFRCYLLSDLFSDFSVAVEKLLPCE